MNEYAHWAGRLSANLEMLLRHHGSKVLAEVDEQQARETLAQYNAWRDALLRTAAYEPMSETA